MGRLVFLRDIEQESNKAARVGRLGLVSEVNKYRRSKQKEAKGMETWLHLPALACQFWPNISSLIISMLSGLVGMGKEQKLFRGIMPLFFIHVCLT